MIDQKELLILIEQYQDTDNHIIKSNIVKHIKQQKLKSKYIADKMGLDIQTIYLWRQPKKDTGIDFILAVKLAELLGINITDLMV